MAKIAEEPLIHTQPGQDGQSQAVSTYMSRPVFSSWPVTLQDWSNYTATATPTYRVNAAFSASCSSVTAALAAIPPGATPPAPPACPDGKWATGTLSAYYSRIGIESAKSAALARPTGVPAPAPTGAPGATYSQPAQPQPSVGASQTVSIVTVESTMTSYYTSTVTLSPSAAPVNPGAQGPDMRLHTLFTVHGGAGASMRPQAAAPANSHSGTVDTTNHPPDPCDDAPPSPQEHIDRHRAHARQFGG